ncbi:uncharacterized protein LOC112639659 [Camponotus floridanus]|uniref:uncharacterized protein LOC105248387 n=1 Tax=Camponotus floridanus TaxID=104421 RepID=UPI000DC68A96|nr:uncharacterized protein LOC105248387 [Camponotus floridanus]XP_025270215.1 uncharacterized protein LOC112639659 [Camponotus floridanus]
MGVFIGTVSTIAIGSILIAYIQCTYVIRCAMHINMLKNIKSKKENSILEGIISAVNIHRQAMKLSKFLESKMETMMFCLIMSGVLSLSLNLFRVFQIVSSGYDIQELLMPFASVSIAILYMFIGNYATQNVTDHNNDVFATVYDVEWHERPLHIQKIILFLLQKGAKEFTLGAGGLFVGSLECFTTV